MAFHGFDGEVELSMGYLIGVRGFRLDEMGRFTGWSFETVWTPGENVAVCGRYNWGCGYDVYFNDYHDHTDDCKRPNPCDGELEDCDHGFWAYFDDFDDQGGENLIEDTYPAIIRGYGRTVIGDKGFRSEKAEILAVTIPHGYDHSPIPSSMVKRNYPNLRIYEHKAAMFADYPAKDETRKVPRDPTDPAFWSFDPKNNPTIIRRYPAQQEVRV